MIITYVILQPTCCTKVHRQTKMDYFKWFVITDRNLENGYTQNDVAE